MTSYDNLVNVLGNTDLYTQILAYTKNRVNVKFITLVIPLTIYNGICRVIGFAKIRLCSNWLYIVAYNHLANNYKKSPALQKIRTCAGVNINSNNKCTYMFDSNRLLLLP